HSPDFRAVISSGGIFCWFETGMRQIASKRELLLAGNLSTCLSPTAFHKSSDSFGSDLDLIHGGREAAAQVTFTTGTKRTARDTCDLLFCEQLDRNFFRTEARRLDAWEGIEVPAWEIAK